jgi:outer membrane protein assembly factor BamB
MSLQEPRVMSRWLSLPLAGVFAVTAAGADWRQFRGSDSTGVAAGPAVPQQFGPDRNLAWKADLPGRGPSSPVVVGGRVFVTASGGPKQDRLYVLAFDAHTGRRLWQRTFWGTGPTASHPKTAMASPTPASDGRRLVALFATNDLVCLDLDGNVLWVRALHEENPGATDGRGLASSPLIVGPTVVVHVENQNTSFAAGIDLETGQNRWRVDRPRELCWSSPIALPGKTPADALVLLQGSTRLSACDPMTGKEVWGLARDSDAIASSVVGGGTLFVPGEKGLAALALRPDRGPPKALWESLKLNPVTASPVVFGGRLYSLRGAILVSGDVKTGEVRSQLRLKGPFSSSIVAAGGLLYCINEAGVAHVVKPGEKEDTLVESCDLKDTILCTPAIADGALYVRSDGHLWKFAKS